MQGSPSKEEERPFPDLAWAPLAKSEGENRRLVFETRKRFGVSRLVIFLAVSQLSELRRKTPEHDLFIREFQFGELKLYM